VSTSVKVSVCDLIVIEREEELPEVCPSCGARLEEVGVVLHEYRHEWLRTKIKGNVHHWGSPTSGQDSILVYWECGTIGCDEVLISSDDRRISAECAPTELLQWLRKDPACPFK